MYFSQLIPVPKRVEQLEAIIRITDFDEQNRQYDEFIASLDKERDSYIETINSEIREIQEDSNKLREKLLLFTTKRYTYLAKVTEKNIDRNDKKQLELIGELYKYKDIIRDIRIHVFGKRYIDE